MWFVCRACVVTHSSEPMLSCPPLSGHLLFIILSHMKTFSLRSLLAVPMAAALAFVFVACNESGDSKSGQAAKSKKGAAVSEADAKKAAAPKVKQPAHHIGLP